MMAWMLYALLVTLVLSAATLMAERAARGRSVPTRWPWIASMLGSLIVPTAMAFASIHLPDSMAGNSTSTSLILSDTTSIRTPLTRIHFDEVPVYGLSISVDTAATYLWATASALMLLVLSLGLAWVSRRKHEWRIETIGGERVRIASDTGPAVIGLIRSEIVVPEWVLKMSRSQQGYVLAHERSHLEARDPYLIAMALTLLTLMPWNGLLWWQFNRLRRAIEMDCDARVLREGGSVAAYCETLIYVGQRKSKYIPLLPAMSESASFLELRIRQMLSKQGRWARESFALLIILSIGMTVVAAQVTPPTAIHPATRSITTSDSSVLDRYTGFYQISPISVIHVTQAGGALSVSISGQMAAPEPFHLTRTSNDQFAVQGNDTLTVRFAMDTTGRALRLIATQSGRVILDRPRIDEATAYRISDALAARIKAQKPFPGSEKALRLLLDDHDSGAGMSPELAWQRQQQKAARETYLSRIGEVRSYTFTGVNEFGSDTYLVKRKNGDETIMLVVDEDGTLANAVRYSPIAAPPGT